MEKENKKNVYINILRWIGIPFASVLASVLSYAVGVTWCGVQNGAFERYSGVEVTSLTKIILLLACYCVSGYTFVMAGVYTAPAHKRVTAIVLATAFTSICAFSMIYSFFSPEYSLMDIITVAFSAIAAIVAAHQCYAEK